MRQMILEFFKRGLIASGFGPVILAIAYLISHHFSGVETITIHQVCLGIFSLTALAFIAGGMNVIYQIEQLALSIAILIHGSVLYISYLGVYLINGWLAPGKTPILFFSAIFILGYLAIWLVIYSITKRRTAKLNEMLKQKQQSRR